MTLTNFQIQSTHNVKSLLKLRNELYPRVQVSLTMYCTQAREAQSRGQLLNFTEGDHVSVACSNFHPCKNTLPSLVWTATSYQDSWR